jgi:cell division protein FtsQ
MMPAIAAPADKRFRRSHVKPGRKRRVPVRQAWLAVKVVAVLAMTIYGGWRAVTLILGTPAFQISRITMRGNERLSRGEVLALLDGLRGRNILTVDLKEWQERVLASPWVASAELRRMLPGRIDVELQERHPIGIGRLAKSLYLIDASGIVIDEYGPNYSEFDLPIIDGLAAVPSDGSGAVDVRRVRLAANVMAALQAKSEIAAQVSQIDVSDAHDAVVLLAGDTTLLRLGDADFVDRIQQYLDVAPALRERVSEIDYVDLRFDERLYLRPVKAPRRTSK